MSEPIQITKEQFNALLIHIEGLGRRIEAFEQSKKQDSDWYIERVKAGKTVCSGCINALYTGITDREKIKHEFEFKCLLSAAVENSVHECSQFVASKNPYISLIETDKNYYIIKNQKPVWES